ncbi:hypothetical protein N9143_01370 [bacterium]|nr:hypothetical protein [bacterium]MDB4456672.1 hypothetical protein [bacterium]
MGQQLRTNTKRRRRKDYLKRKKEQAKNSAAVKKSAPKAEKAPAKKAAKKVAKKTAKKVAKKAAKKVETPAAEQDLGKVYDKAPDNVDDLKKIGGVGPALEGKLNGFGVYTFEQIAAWTPANIAAFDDLLSFKGRIERDDWLKQAKEFAAAE